MRCEGQVLNSEIFLEKLGKAGSERAHTIIKVVAKLRQGVPY